jgi:hypothetical protein
VKKNCVPLNSTQLLYWQNFECLDKNWRTWPKFLGRVLTSRALTPVARVLTKVSSVDLSKVFMGEC